MSAAAADWNHRWDAINARAEELKDSPSAIPALFQAYRSLHPNDLPDVDAVISDAIESDDPTRRFDAIALVREFRIRAAEPSLSRLATRLRGVNSPEARAELEKVDPLLATLTSHDSE